MFEQTFLGPPAKTRRAWTVMASFAIQVLVVGLAVLAPMVFLEKLPRAFLAAPRLLPPPPPGAPKNLQPVEIVAAIREIRPAAPRGLVEPARIPAGTPALVEEAPAVEVADGGFFVPGGSGAPDGVRGGLWRDLEDHARRVVVKPPAPPPPAVRPPQAAPPEPSVERIEVGGKVQEAKLVRRIMPAYPVLARQARIEGTVRLEAIIGRDGSMRQLRLVRGHHLLAPAAVEAVRQWLYEPTLLNGRPVEVATTIDVHFTLSR